MASSQRHGMMIAGHVRNFIEAMERPLLAQSGRLGIWNLLLCQLPERNKESRKNRGFYRARAVRVRKIDPAPIWSWSSALVSHRLPHGTLRKEAPVPVLMCLPS